MMGTEMARSEADELLAGIVIEFEYLVCNGPWTAEEIVSQIEDELVHLFGNQN